MLQSILLPTTSIELKELCELLAVALIVPTNADQYHRDKRKLGEARRKLKDFETEKTIIMKQERTAYMQHLMTSTYSLVPIIAIEKGTLTGAWEEAIATQLMIDQISPNGFRVNDAMTILKEVEPNGIWDKQVCLKAADYILNHTIIPK